jgi:hypothetical protein
MFAQVDDRDVAQLFEALELDGKPAGDEALMHWLDGGSGSLALRWRGKRIPAERIGREELPQRLGFVPAPAPDA